MPRCIGCDCYCEVYFCQGCAYQSDYYAARSMDHERRASTATTIGRRRRMRQGDAVAYEQFMACQDLTNHKTVSMRMSASDRGTSSLFHAMRERPILADVGALSKKTRIRNRIRRKVAAFAKAWGAIGWQLLDDLTRPERS